VRLWPYKQDREAHDRRNTLCVFSNRFARSNCEGLDGANSKTKQSKDERQRLYETQLGVRLSMRTCKLRWSALAAITINLLLSLTSPTAAQKVTVDTDNPANLAHFKRYAWGKNHMVTALRPEDVTNVEAVLNDSINRQLQSKGYVLDEKNPDFRISYDAGGQIESGAGIRPDLLRMDTYGQGWVAPMDVWATTLAQMQINIVGVSSNAPLWRAMVSQKVSDRDKFLRDLNRNIDKITASALKKFPAAAKGS